MERQQKRQEAAAARRGKIEETKRGDLNYWHDSFLDKSAAAKVHKNEEDIAKKRSWERSGKLVSSDKRPRYRVPNRLGAKATRLGSCNGSVLITPTKGRASMPSYEPVSRSTPQPGSRPLTARSTPKQSPRAASTKKRGPSPTERTFSASRGTTGPLSRSGSAPIIPPTITARMAL